MSVGRGEEPPKVGSTIALPIDGKAERQFKVLKTEKQPDGTYLSELKDVKTGEALSLLTRPDDQPKKPPLADDSKLPKPKARTNDPMSFTAQPLPPKEPEKEKDKHPFLHRIFGDKDKDKAGGASAMPATDPSADTNKRPGLMGRIFGPKKPTGPSMPSATMTQPPIKSSPSTPPPVLPVPPGGLAPDRAPVQTAPPAVFPSTPSPTGEPPRVMPARPPAPPMPAFPAPIPTPMPMPVPTPMPAPISVPPIATPVPAPVVPPLPVPSVPTIPVPPGGTSATKPLQVVVPAGHMPAELAFDRDVEPYVVALQTMAAPSARLSAAKGLAEGRHGSTEGVKSVLFQSAQLDPCGEVRAACITHLCGLGYYTPQFLAHIQAAREDTDPLVRAAATAACGKMMRK
jgi:hypothetical protein